MTNDTTFDNFPSARITQ